MLLAIQTCERLSVRMNFCGPGQCLYIVTITRQWQFTTKLNEVAIQNLNGEQIATTQAHIGKHARIKSTYFTKKGVPIV
jgi:hypothetical protein